MKIKKNDVKKIIGIFIIYKILIISVAYSAWLIPEDLTIRKHSDVALLDPFAQLDARAYLDIAKNGYNIEFNGTSNYGWYPLYPLLILIFSFLSFELAAFLISNIFSFISVLLLYILVRDEFGEKIGKKSIFYLLFFPTSFFLTTMYTESLFLTLVLGMFILAKEEKWHYVGILGFLASLTRPQGILMFIPMVYMYIRKSKLRPGAAWLLLIPAGILAFMAYQYLITGDALIQFYTHGKYVRELSLPSTAFFVTIRDIFLEQRILDVAVNVFNLAITLFLISLAYMSYKHLKPEYTIYFILSLLMPLFSSSLASISRFGLMMFPVFMIIAIKSENKKNKILIILLYAFFIIALVLGTIRYVNEDIIL